jgi:rubrerythrin
VKQRLKETKRGSVPLMEALSACVDVENTFIEARYFEIIESDGPELKELLKTLAADFEAHRERLRQALEGERGVAP